MTDWRYYTKGEMGNFSGQDGHEQKNSSKHPVVEANDPETSHGSSDWY